MGTLTIHIQKFLDDWSGEYRDGAGEVVGTIRALDPDKPPISRSLRSVLIPVGGRAANVKLPRGRYLVDAVLPSGDLASREVDVPLRGTVDLYLDIEHSPREWLSWQHLAGNVGIQDLDAVSVDRIGGRGLVAAAQVPWIIREPLPLKEGKSPLDHPANLRSRARNRIALDQFAMPQKRGFPRKRNSDGPYESYVLSGEFEEYERLGPSASQEPNFRWYVDVETGLGGNVRVVVPIPWRNTRTGLAVDLDVLVTHGGRLVDSSSATTIETDCSIVVRDPVMSTVIAYLSSGGSVAACQVFDDAELALFLKRGNAIAAAAGGYVLLAANESRGRQSRLPWKKWIENLANWFDWLPDGAIQRSWLSLQSPETAHTQETRAVVLDAYRRGIPFYSAGVQMLRDALVVLSRHHEADPEIDEALESTRRLALGVDPTRAFTTIRTSSEDRSRSWTGLAHEDVKTPRVDTRANVLRATQRARTRRASTA
jgi:hypothetical protein